jgi:hypothetical protein
MIYLTFYYLKIFLYFIFLNIINILKTILFLFIFYVKLFHIYLL